jgi:hypothetical protein
MKRRTITIAACLLGVAALVAVAGPFSHEAAWRVAAADRPWVERTVRSGAGEFRMSPEEFRAHTRPRVRRGAGRVCVWLRSRRRDEGSYEACYLEQDGRVIWELTIGPTFGATRWWDRVWPWIW